MLTRRRAARKISSRYQGLPVIFQAEEVGGKDEEDGGEKAAGDADGGDGAEAAQGGIVCDGEGAEAGDGGEAGEDDGFDDGGKGVLFIAGLSHGEKDIDAIVDADSEDEGEGEDVEEIEGEAENFEQAIIAADGKREADHQDEERGTFR